MDVSRELVDPCDWSCEPPGRLVHSSPSEEGSFSWWLLGKKKKNKKLNYYVHNMHQLPHLWKLKTITHLQNGGQVFSILLKGT